LGSAPNLLGECSPDPVAGFKGYTSKGRERTGRKEGRSEEIKGKGRCCEILKIP